MPSNKENNLPPNWSWITVSDVGEVVTGTTPSKKNIEFYGNDYPLYKPTDLNAGINTLVSADNISKLGATKARLLPARSIMVTCIGATIGKTGMNKTKGATNQQINSIVPNEKYVSEFIYYFCISKFFQDQIKNHASSTTLPILNKTKFESLPFIEVPKAQQTQIVEKIEELFSGLVSGVASLKKAKEQIKLYRQSILSAAFSGRLVGEVGGRQAAVGKEEMLKAAEPVVPYANQLPAGWKWVKLGDIITPSKERFDPLENRNKKYVGLAHIEKGTGKVLGYADSNTLRSTKTIFKKGDLLYGKLRPYLNKVAIADYDGVCSTDILVFEKQSDLSNDFLKYRILQEDFVSYAQNNMSGVQHPRINFKSISVFKIGLPDYSQQTQIVEEIESRFAGSEALEKAIDESLNKSDMLRQSILKKAFEGRLT